MQHDACARSTLDGGAVVEVEAGGVKILLSASGETVSAVGALCVHKGAPLKNGARFGDRILCPWHHAIFDLVSGDHLEPPGKGCLTRFPVTVSNGRVLVEVAEGASPQRPEVRAEDRRDGGSETFLIVGAGAAGLACAEELVKLGFDGRILMVSPEDEPPYDRTDLSKTYLGGKTDDAKLPLVTDEALAALGIERVVGEVEAIEANDRRVRLKDGSALPYDKCFAAPGSAAARLDLPNADAENVHVLRSHGDAKALKRATAAAAHIVIVGSGFIGLEAAAQLASAGKRVSVIARDKLPFARQFGPRIAQQIADQHREKGVALHTEAEVESFRAENNRVTAVRLKSGVEVEADLVLVSVGAAPRTKIVDPSAGKGIEVDPDFRHGPDLFLGGDIAAIPLPGREKPLRIEHWRVAEGHGRHAARVMMGQEARYRGVPFFWTAQYSRISYVGHADSADDIHIEGDFEGLSYTAYFIERGRVTAALGRGKGDRTPQLHAVMRRDPTPARERLEAAGWDPAKLLE